MKNAVKVRNRMKQIVSLLLAIIFTLSLNSPIIIHGQSELPIVLHESGVAASNYPVLQFDAQGELLNSEILLDLFSDVEEEYIGWIECPIAAAEQEPEPEIYIGWTECTEPAEALFEPLDDGAVIEYYFGWPEDFCFDELLEYYLAQEEYIGWTECTEPLETLIEDNHVTYYYFGWPEDFCPDEYTAPDYEVTEYITCWETSPNRHELDAPVPRNAATLSISANSWRPASGAATMFVLVTSNRQWTVTRPANATWISFEGFSPANRTGNGNFTIRITANTGSAARSSTVSVAATGATTRTINIEQAAPAAILSLSQSVWNPGAGTSEATINVASNRAWTVTRNQTWFTVTPTSGSNNGSFRINAPANTGTTSRSGTVTVSGGGITRTVTINQAAPVILTVSPSSTWNSPAAGGNTTINVTSNITWNTPTSSHSWLTVSNITPTNRNGNGSFRINTTANTGVYTRSANITVSAPGATTRTISVSQAPQPGVLTISQSSWSITSASSAGTFNVASNRTWQISSPASWLSIGSITPASQTGNGSFRVTASANTGTSSRTGTVTVSIPGVTRNLSVTQGAAPNLTLSHSGTWNPLSSGDNSTINITSNITWNSPSSNQSWLTISQVTPANRTGNGSFRITASANTGTTTRTGTVTISGSGITRTINVNQVAPAPVLTISPTGSWNPLSTGGSTTVSVTSNRAWTVSSSNTSWLNASPGSGSGNGSFTITAAHNSGSAARSGTITVSATGVTSRTISVTQPGTPTLNLSHSAWAPQTMGEFLTVTVTSNGTWFAGSNATTWLTVSNFVPASRTGNGSFGINATPNTGTTVRTGTITVTAPGAPTRTVSVAQNPPEANLTLSRTTWNPPHTTSSETVTVTSNRTWSVSSNVNWLTTSNVTPANQTGNGSFRIDAIANPNTTSRTGTITVTVPGLTPRVVTVTQAARTTFRVTFNPQGGSVSESFRDVPVGSAIGQLPVPSRTGYEFLGWLETPRSTTPFGEELFEGAMFEDFAPAHDILPFLEADFQPTRNVTIYAWWARVIFITLNLDGGAVDFNQTFFATTAGRTLASLPFTLNPTKDGYDFAGWFDAPTANATRITIFCRLERSKTLYARWTPATSDTVMITFAPNGATSSINPPFMRIRAGQSISSVGAMPVPVRIGYQFAGWHQSPTGPLSQINEHAPIHNDMILYARWIIPITLHPNMGNEPPTTVLRVSGVPLGNLPSPRRTGPTLGRVVDGWHTTPSGGTTVNASTFTPNTSTTYYARWVNNIDPFRHLPMDRWWQSNTVPLRQFTLHSSLLSDLVLWDSAINAGISIWNNSAAPITFSYPVSTNNTINVEPVFGNQNVGWLRAWPGGLDPVTRFEIELNSFAIEGWASDPVNNTTISRVITHTMAHELGHAVGLWDRYASIGDFAYSVMQINLWGQVLGPTQFDVESVRMIYD